MPGEIMSSITENYLKNLKDSKKLDSFTALDLQDKNIENLSSEVFNKLQSLEVLNLSKNNLRSIPSDLHLPKLRKLDVSENQLESIEFVQQFPALEELYMEDNALEASDRYIAATLQPSLKVVDKSKGQSFFALVSSTKDKLLPVVQQVWEDKFDTSTGIPQEEIEADFVAKVKAAKSQRHTSLVKFTNFMVKFLCREHLKSVAKPSRTSSKRGRCSDSELSPLRTSKRRRVDKSRSPASKTPPKTPQKSSHKLRSPAKTPQKSLQKLRSPATKTPRKSVSPKSPAKSPQTPENKTTASASNTPRKSSREIRTPKKFQDPDSVLPSLPDYNPVHFVRCHFGDKEAKRYGHSLSDPTDNVTPVWSCAFEPNPADPEETTNVVATCGGSNVCLLDCCSGKVLKRFQDTSMQFYCLAWTTLTLKHEGRRWPTNILAVAGTDSFLKLIHPEQFVCYAEIGSKRPKVACRKFMTTSLIFDQEEPELLYCASSDSTITLWNIGVPSGPDYQTDIRHLQTFVSNSGGIQSMILTTDYLVAGCEENISAWKFPVKATASQERCRFLPPCAKLHVTGLENEPINSMVNLAEDLVACKTNTNSKIYIWRLSTTLKGVRKVKDSIVITPFMVLEWADTDVEDIGLGIMDGVVGCGDDKGNILLYNLENALHQKQLVKGLVKPSRSIAWPKCDIESKREEEQKMEDVLKKEETIVMNCVTFSSSCEYLVAGTDNNLVCIWKQHK